MNADAISGRRRHLVHDRNLCSSLQANYPCLRLYNAIFVPNSSLRRTTRCAGIHHNAKTYLQAASIISLCCLCLTPCRTLSRPNGWLAAGQAVAARLDPHRQSEQQRQHPAAPREPGL